MSTDEPMENITIENPRTKEERVIETLEAALTGHSGVSKNTLIKEAIKILKS